MAGDDTANSIGRFTRRCTCLSLPQPQHRIPWLRRILCFARHSLRPPGGRAEGENPAGHVRRLFDREQREDRGRQVTKRHFLAGHAWAASRDSHPEYSVGMMHPALQTLYLVKQPEERHRLSVRTALQQCIMLQLRVDDAAREYVGPTLFDLHCLTASDAQTAQALGRVCRVALVSEAQMELLRHHRLNLLTPGDTCEFDKGFERARPIERLSSDVLIDQTRLLTECRGHHYDGMRGSHGDYVSHYAIHFLVTVADCILIFGLIGVRRFDLEWFRI